MLGTMLYIVVYQLLLCNMVYSTKNFTISKIGVFEDDDIVTQQVFVLAVEKANKIGNQTRISPIIVTVAEHDMVNTTNQVCDALRAKSVALFGRMHNPIMASRIYALASAKEIPHFYNEFGPDFCEGFTLYPSPRTIGSAVAALIRHYSWPSFLILYEDGSMRHQLEDILHNLEDNRSISFRKFPADSVYSKLLGEIKDVLQEWRIVIQAGLNISVQFLDQIDEKMISKRCHFIFTDLDVMHLLDLRNISHVCTISGLRLIQQDELHSTNGFPGTIPAIIYDSVMLLYKALNAEADHLEAESLSCQFNQTWTGGPTLFKAITEEKYNGLTGAVTLDSDGQRNGTLLSVVELTEHGFKKIGTWDENRRLLLGRNQSLPREGQRNTLRVAINIDSPFTMLQSSDNGTLTGNERFKGYCIDLLNQLANILKFNYTIYVVSDGISGVKDENGVWNGLMGEITRKEADFSASPLAITKERNEAVSFTVPFMHSGIGILYKRAEEKSVNLFSILSPLSLQVWLCILAAFAAVSLAIFILDRISPQELHNPHDSNADSDSSDKKFDLLSSFWFTVKLLIQQGSDRQPTPLSTRCLATFWSLFALIIVSSYTANLAAFLTVERMISPIKSVEDLAKQTKVKYGLNENAATLSFFKNSKIHIYEKMWTNMKEAKPSVLVKTEKEGIQRVKDENFAYLTVTPTIEYHTAKDCTLVQIGGIFHLLGFAFAFQKDSPYVEAFNSAILELQDSGNLEQLKYKWWMGSEQCLEETNGTNNTSSLGFQSVAGAFIILLFGLCLSFVITAVQSLYKLNRKRVVCKIN